jgi:short-subunit dehydrogenase
MSATETATQRRKDGRLRSRYGGWAVVTGASSGIGREFARRLAADGMDVVLSSRRRDALEALAAELTASYGVEARVAPADLSRPEGVEAVIRAADGLDAGLLVHAAGFGSSGPFLESDPAEELAMIDVNCRAAAALSMAFGRRFAERRRGGIVLMSSLLAFQGVPMAANYAATKAYVQSLAEALHRELSPAGVDVVASAPGPVHTGFAARARMTMGFAQGPEGVAAATLSALGRRMTVRPGLLSKFLEASLKLLPRWGRVLMMGRVMRGMASPSRAAASGGPAAPGGPAASADAATAS